MKMLVFKRGCEGFSELSNRRDLNILGGVSLELQLLSLPRSKRKFQILVQTL
jgi:hypothetical protein